MLYFILGAITLAIIEWIWISYFKGDTSTNRYSTASGSNTDCERKLQELKNKVSDKEAQIGHLQARISVMEKDADQSSLPSKTPGNPGKPNKNLQAKAAAPKKQKAAAKKVQVKKKAPSKKVVRGKKAPVKASVKKKAVTKSRPDDLKKVSGIGPKIAGLMKADGINSFATLAKANVAQLDKILEQAGSRFSMADASSWPKQANLLQQGDIAALQKFQKSLKNK